MICGSFSCAALRVFLPIILRVARTARGDLRRFAKRRAAMRKSGADRNNKAAAVLDLQQQGAFNMLNATLAIHGGFFLGLMLAVAALI
ncbi:MAG: hypothetical protein GW905_02485 [Rhodobacterales bacterium]|nr:hypothetical protein [Rhodobacterales bacterium]